MYAFVHIYSVPVFHDAVWGLWLLCIAGLSFWLGSTLDDLRGLYRGLAIGASVSSVIGILQYLGHPVVARVSEHPAGLYVNSVVQGMVLAILIVAFASERMWFWTLPLWPGLALSHSRGAWLALAIGLLSVYVRRAWVFALVGIVGVLYWRSVGAQSSDETRLIVWNAATHFLTPWGWGPGSFFSWIIPYRDTFIQPEYAHNDALQLVFEYGVFAVLPAVIFVFVLSRTQTAEWPIVVTFATLGCYSMPLLVPITAFLACVAAGRIVRGWAMARAFSDHGRFNVLPWIYGERRTVVPVASSYPAKG